MNIIDSRNLLKLDLDPVEDAEQIQEIEDMKAHIYGFAEGVALIDIDDFEEYAQQTADDLYGVPYHWPFDHINWKTATESLKQSYSTVTYDGIDYYYEVR